MNYKFQAAVVPLFLFCVSCSSVTIDLKPTSQPLQEKPTFTDYRSYFFWGFLQSRHISVGKACLGRSPLRLRSYASGEDILLTVFTLGLYTSRTLDVWCEEAQSPEQKSAMK